MADDNSNPDAAAANDSSKPPSSTCIRIGDRQLFHVELRPGETTIVSWKKLLKDANKTNEGSTSAAPEQVPKANPALEARIAPGQAENNEQDAPQTNRFSAVIEKIERLYMGNDSDDEDLPVVPDDQYDTEDSFIDDAELDEYFEVDDSVIKHDGFFINRGKLERINEPPALPNQPAKKRCRKDILKNPGENIDGRVSNKHVKVGKTAAGKTAPLPVKNTLNSSQNLAVPGEHYADLKSQNQLEVSRTTLKKEPADIRPISDPSASLKVSNNDVSSAVEAKDADKQKTILQSKNRVDKHKDASGVHDTSHQKHQEKKVSVPSKSQLGGVPSSIDDLENTGRSKEKNGISELPDLSLSEGKSVMQAPKSKNILKKAGSSVRPKSTTLEKAIQDLEKTVAESRPPTTENQEVDSTSQAIKRRLPREIKLKLAKVARLAASQGKVSQEVVNRLMSILGHLIQLRTLKRNLKIMINTGLSAKKEKDDRFQQKKKEVAEMIKMLPPSIDSEQLQQAGASGDQELGPDGKAISKRLFTMDTALEDKICDLYDLFVDGLDETAGPLIRKLYAELAALWPNGCMDNHGIKRAICRAKERRRALHSRNKDQEKIKRKNLLAPQPEKNVQFDASPQQNMRKRLAPESSSHTSLNKAVSNTVTDVRVLPSPVNGLKKEKAKTSSSCSPDDVRVADGVLIKKVKKRKTEGELEGTHRRPEKLASLKEEERPRSLKQSAVAPPKSNLQPTSLPGVEQSS
ncbi:ubinuclein-1-like isoform X2 [Vicia villosa]|uniref:ubinuclein-1-like isoform X2 n=1 Tax=Vicia villosa TaxID=3911 RepID=UPI00273B2896|nr:ubinuclein-1-like isoform X2 [Vicia villosa]